jgi:hypothetical protein
VHWRIIELIIENCSSEIFDSILDGCNYDNSNKRDGSETRILDSENAENL